MTRDVVAVTKDMPLKDVARTMAAHSISGVPVVDGAGKLVGMVSRADIVHHSYPGVA
jgi:CBS domain-containing protein